MWEASISAAAAVSPIPLLSPVFLGDVLAASWNCQTLFGATSGNHAHQSATFGWVQRLAAYHHVVCLQETHGVSEDLVSLGKLFPHHHLLGSFGRSHAAGGLVVIISKDFVTTFPDDHDLWAGCIFRVSLSTAKG